MNLLIKEDVLVEEDVIEQRANMLDGRQRNDGYSEAKVEHIS